MNETNRPDAPSAVPWPTSDMRKPLSDLSTTPGSDGSAPAAPPATRMLDQAVHRAHDTLDRLAEGVAPAVQKVGDRVSAAGDALNARTDQLRETRDEWVDGMRSTVRGNPLACLAAAVVLGAVIARLGR